MKAYLDWIHMYNLQVKGSEKIRGVMADIEPYVDKKWKESPGKYMDIYVSGMKKAYKSARKKDLVFLACIPNHYDSQGLEDGLEELIEDACDGIAVMDYSCGYEAERIRTEAEFAIKHSKSLHCILEFQEVGKHGLTENETYYNKGLDQAEAAWEEVSEQFPEYPIIRDYHWREPMEEILSR